MRILLLTWMLLAATVVAAQAPYQTYKDEKTGWLTMEGPLSITLLLNEPSFGWMRRGMADYQPDSVSISYLRKALPGCHLVLLLGTWCSDSHELVPRLARVLQLAGFPEDQMEVIGVNRKMKAPGQIRARYHLRKVPTLIISKNGYELGRIVEVVQQSIEQDLADLLSKAFEASTH